MLKDNLIKLGLGPILLAQGKYVRRVTPILPEAEGARSGSDEESDPGDEHEPQKQDSRPDLRVLIVGDSAAAGVGVASQDDALAGQLIRALAPNYRVSWELIARTGWTTRHLLEHLDTVPGTNFDIVVTSLGVNEVLRSVSPQAWREGQLELIELLREKFGASLIMLTHVPPMHRFPSLPQPLRWFLGRHAKQLNRELHALSESLPDCQTIEVDFPLTISADSNVMAADGFHPGAAGYTLWASQISELIDEWSKQ